MRKIILFTLSIFPLFLNAQCIVNAGEDQNICDFEPYPQLKGQVIQGDSIISLKWEARSQDGDVFFYASNMLSDTTILAPQFHTHYNRTVLLFLTATDINGEACTDSVTYHFSDWSFLTIDKADIKDPSDTISLWPAGGSNFPIVKFEWSPNYNISNVNVSNPKVWNDTTTTYYLLLTDSIGCSMMDDPFEVYIRTTPTHSTLEQDLVIFPNPVRAQLYIQGFNRLNTILISDQQGRPIRKVVPSRIIPMDDLTAGIYYLTFTGRDGAYFTKKILKQ